MKQLLSTLVLICCAHIVYAQQEINRVQFQRDFASIQPVKRINNALLPNTTVAFNYAEEKYLKFKRMRTAGIVLTGVGAAIITTGAIISRREWKADDFNGDRFFLGILCSVLGAASTGGGIAMHTIGNIKMKKYRSSSIILTPIRSGLGVAYSF